MNMCVLKQVLLGAVVALQAYWYNIKFAVELQSKGTQNKTTYQN